jgi:purine-nucleoside phosphorylase
MEQLNVTTQFLIEKGISNATVGVVLGTGLHKILEHIEVLQSIPYNEIPNFPVSTVEFHKGNLVYGKLGDKHVMIMQGRFHQYEGYDMQQIAFPVRVMKMLGIKALFLSNAAGGINLTLKKGDLVLLDDHINLQSGNPLTGKNYDDLGGRFPDMSEPYSKKLNNLLLSTASKLNLELKTGVYAAVNGPNLETRAEYRYLKIIGADMVGMSTVPEVIAANHCALFCAAISVITDECDPDNLKPINIAEIIETAGKADEKVAAILKETITILKFEKING